MNNPIFLAKGIAPCQEYLKINILIGPMIRFFTYMSMIIKRKQKI